VLGDARRAVERRIGSQERKVAGLEGEAQGAGARVRGELQEALAQEQLKLTKLKASHPRPVRNSRIIHSTIYGQ
jgi:hypothetical protein